jgi:enoyl-CoA hydratase/carnithine racemase
MEYAEIIYTVDKHVATIKFNRPDRLNAWTPLTAAEVRNALHNAADDEHVRVIILTGSGRGFCAGADMADLKSVADQGVGTPNRTGTAEAIVSVKTGTKTEEELDSENKFNARSDFRKRYSYITSIPIPVIAAVNGPAVGLGLILALYADLRFVSEKARFSTAFSRRGLIAEHGISWVLPRIVGLSNALDMLYSARMVDAQEAFRMGLVNGVFPEEGFMEEVMAYAVSLASSVSPRSLRIIKKQVYEAQFQTLAEATIAADEELLLSLDSEDFKEGVAHFLEKRPPRFTGK